MSAGRMKDREEKMGEQGKGKVTHHRKEEKKKIKVLLAKISLQDRQKKLSIVCARIHQYSAPHTSHQR